MPKKPTDQEQLQLPTHGASILPSVEVKSYNLEIEDDDGFLGDNASKGAFWDLLESWRKPLRDLDADPLGDKPGEEIGKKRLADLLVDGDPEAAGVVHGAIEEFAQALAKIVRRFLKQKQWRDTECIVVGGGFRSSRVGEIAIGRASVLLKAGGIDIDFKLIRHSSDEAGLIGAAHLLPAWMLAGHDAILAVDVGGTNIRAGIVEVDVKKARDLSKAKVLTSQLWRHSAEGDLKRDEAIERLCDMLQQLAAKAEKQKLQLAPVIGIACPGVIEEDGSIARGAQNLPGNWESSRFNLPSAIASAIPRLGGHETMVVMHNDAVVQGLSALPYVQEHAHWAVLTIGTGLGNASFATRAAKK